MSKIKKNIFVENAEIVDISSEGKSVAKVEGMVIFGDGGVPGDVADVMITRKKNNYAELFKIIGAIHSFCQLQQRQ